MKNKATHFGAGNIGRGFIGEVLSKNNYHINFIDTNENLTHILNKMESYEITFIGTSKKYKVDSFSAILASNTDEVIKSLLESEIITISVGATNLKYLVDVFNKFLLTKSKDKNTLVQNIVCAENGVGVSSIFRKMLEIPSSLNGVVSFVDAAVDRIVPIQEGNDVKKVEVEEFYELALDETSWLGERKIEGADYYKNVLPAIRRKLFMLNGTHALIAWHGFSKYKFIHQYVDHPKVVKEVHSYLDYLVDVLVASDGWDKDVILKYKEKIKSRVQNKALNDDIARVGRNVSAKLAKEERIVQPLLLGNNLGMDLTPSIHALLKGYSLMDGFQDKQYLELQEYLRINGLKKSIAHFSSITDEKLINKILTI